MRPLQGAESHLTIGPWVLSRCPQAPISPYVPSCTLRLIPEPCAHTPGTAPGSPWETPASPPLCSTLFTSLPFLASHSYVLSPLLKISFSTKKQKMFMPGPLLRSLFGDTTVDGTLTVCVA